MNTPLMWHDSQRVVVCEPLSGKPVLKCSNFGLAPWAEACIGVHPAITSMSMANQLRAS